MEAFDRIVAAKRVQGYEEVVRFALVVLLDRYAMSETAQYPGPSQRRDAVAMA
jgi:hypothetical protein